MDDVFIKEGRNSLTSLDNVPGRPGPVRAFCELNCDPGQLSGGVPGQSGVTNFYMSRFLIFNGRPVK